MTWNRSDFPADALARWGLGVLDPDEYLAQLITDLPREVVGTAVRLAAEKRNPPLSPLDLVASLS